MSKTGLSADLIDNGSHKHGELTKGRFMQLTDVQEGKQLVSVPHDKWGKKVKDFDGALTYQNPFVVRKFAERYGVPIEQASRQFEEVKKFLLICALTTECCSPTKLLDDIWHEFIIHTKAYQDYCERYIGKFIHHRPTDGSFNGSRRVTKELAIKLFSNLDPDIWVLTEEAICDSCGDDGCCGQ